MIALESFGVEGQLEKCLMERFSGHGAIFVKPLPYEIVVSSPGHEMALFGGIWAGLLSREGLLWRFPYVPVLIIGSPFL